MKLRMGRVIAGFAVGYYLGSKAGHERFEQLDLVLRKATSAPGVRNARDKVVAAFDLGTMAAKDAVSEALAYEDEGYDDTVELRWTHEDADDDLD